MRRAHNLKHNKRTEIPSQLIFVDTETKSVRIDADTEQAVLWFGWACYVRRHHGHQWSKPQWHRFETPGQFWSWVSEHNREQSRVYVYAHNQSFDFTVLQGFLLLPDYGYRLHSAVVEGPPTIITYRRGRASLVILDTLNYWRQSLADLGKAVAVRKLRMPTATSPAYRWDAYCRHDVRVIYRAVLAYLRYLVSADLGSYRPTLASQALSAYRHRFLKADIYIDDNADACALARAAYHGGRTECFRLGLIEGPVYQLDINSQYPACMAAYPMPTKLVGHTRTATLDDLRVWCERRAVVAECLIQTEEPAYGVVRDDRLIFPTGRFKAALTTPEIRYAMQKGHIIRVYQAAVYHAAIIFREFVEFFYRDRQRWIAEGNAPYSVMAKILMNSLYGKFGQAGIVYRESCAAEDLSVRCWLEIDADTGTVYRRRQFGGIVQTLERDGESRDSHPAIAAHVTAYARMLLWTMMREAGRENVFYTDTDSLYVNAAGFARLGPRIHPTELGALKLEAAHHRIALLGAKDYRTPKGWKVKGVRSKAVAIGPDTWEQAQFGNFKGMIRRGDLSRMLIKRVEKNLSRDYTKGTVGSDGLIAPFTLWED